MTPTDQMPGLDQQNQPAAQPVPPGASPPLPGTTDPLAQFKGDIAGISAIDTQAAGAQAGQASQIQSMLPPQRDTAVYDMMPFLLGMTALGGKATGLHSRVMLGALNGMVKGTLMGNQQQFDDAKDQYQQNRQKLLDLFALQNQYYATLRDAYKDRADGDYKAILATQQMSNDEWNKKMDAVKAWQQRQQIALQWKQLDETMNYDKMRNQIDLLRAQADVIRAGKTSGAAGQKAQDHQRQQSEATRLINEVLGLMEKNKGSVLGLTGATGMASRTLERAGNITGVSTGTDAQDFQSKVSELQLLLPKLLTNSSKSAKDERDKVETIARGLHWGDTSASTFSALSDLRDRINNLPAETEGDPATSGLPPETQRQAEQIKEDVASGRMTREEGIAKLKGLGFQ